MQLMMEVVGDEIDQATLVSVWNWRKKQFESMDLYMGGNKTISLQSVRPMAQLIARVRLC